MFYFSLHVTAALPANLLTEIDVIVRQGCKHQQRQRQQQHHVECMSVTVRTI